MASIKDAEKFYQGVLGFEKMMQYGRSAGFVAAGGYHHHIGYNTWAGVGAPPPPPDALGLLYFVIQLPDASELRRVVERVRRASLPIEEVDRGWRVRDPSQNTVLLAAPGEAVSPI